MCFVVKGKKMPQFLKNKWVKQHRHILESRSMLWYYKSIWLDLGGTISSCRDKRVLLLPFPTPALCCILGFPCQLHKKRKIPLRGVWQCKVYMGRTAKEVLLLSGLQPVKLHHGGNIPTLQRCNAISWSRDEEKTPKIFYLLPNSIWCFRMICIGTGDVEKKNKLWTFTKLFKGDGIFSPLQWQ